MSAAAQARRSLMPATVVASLAALGLTTGATARPPGPIIENPRGAQVVVTPSSVVPASKAVFFGTGFTAGEEITVKVDEGEVLKASGADVFAVVTAGSDGAVQGSVDLATAAPPLVAGAHVLRFLSSVPAPRSLKADFAVVLPDLTVPTTPIGTTPGIPSDSTPLVPSVTTPGEDSAATTLKIRSTLLKVSKQHRATLKLAAGAGGSAGKVSIRSALKVQIAKHKPAKWTVLFSTSSYFVSPGGKGTVALKLTRNGRALLAKMKSLKATVVLTDANGAKVTATLAVTV